jgi:small GTP-binding protein
MTTPAMLGGFSVGKTSLVKRYVQSVFSETYLTTVGVKIDKKTVDLSGRSVSLILWDLAGEDDIASLRMSYLRGSAGYMLVADGTRRTTLDVATSLRQRVEADYGPMPFVLLLNKNDLSSGSSGKSPTQSWRASGIAAGGCGAPAHEPAKAWRTLSWTSPSASRAEPWRAYLRAWPHGCKR